MNMFPVEVYTERRAKLHNSIKKGVALFLGNVESPYNYVGNTHHFRQDSSFLYFFGLDIAGIAAVCNFETGQDIIFGNDTDIEDIIWMGQQEPLANKAAKVGVTIVKPFVELRNYIAGILSKKIPLHFLPQYRAENKILLSELIGISIPMQQLYASVDLINAIVALREIKDEHEIADLKKAAFIGFHMHKAAMENTKTGAFEYQISGLLEGIPASYGGHWSFPTILTQNGQTLHNHYHGNKLEKGKLLLIDAGAETDMHYASDYTRTIPVGGRFSEQQKEIYQIVLDANNTVASMIKPGIMYKQAHIEAAKKIVEGLSAIGLMRGNIDDAVANGAHALFFPHGIGHMLGLDVHDMENLGEDYVGYNSQVSRSSQFGLAYLRLAKQLKEGFVVTNEPGIYFIPELIDKWMAEKTNTEYINFDKINTFYRNFGGIRLEDNLIVKQNGAEYVGDRVPVSIPEIEEMMSNSI